MGLFKAILDAILGGVDQLAGQSVTKLTAAIDENETTAMPVESNVRFGEEEDDADDALLLINGELIYAAARASYTSFDTLTRGYNTTTIKRHPKGSIVYDMSHNRTALDHARRGFFTRTARGTDLDVLGRNVGLHKCPGLSEEQWRQIIEVMGYLPNQPIDAFERVLDIYPGVGNYEIVEDLITDPNVVTIKITLLTSNTRKGKFYLNGGYDAVVDGGGATVTLPFTPNDVFGVYEVDDKTSNGSRKNVTNHFASFVGPVITLTGPLAAALPVIVDASKFNGHYLALDETKRYPTNGEYFPYLSDPSAIVTCLLNQVRAAGVRCNFVTVLS